MVLYPKVVRCDGHCIDLSDAAQQLSHVLLPLAKSLCVDSACSQSTCRSYQHVFGHLLPYSCMLVLKFLLQVVAKCSISDDFAFQSSNVLILCIGVGLIQSMPSSTLSHDCFPHGGISFRRSGFEGCWHAPST